VHSNAYGYSHLSKPSYSKIVVFSSSFELLCYDVALSTAKVKTQFKPHPSKHDLTNLAMASPA